ncbi:Protein HEAT INTOLERANT 4 [Ranunculus cassubicifolius]
MAKSKAASKRKQKEIKSDSFEEPTQASMHRRKRVKASVSTEPEYFEEKRNMEDLWQAVFPVGTEWDQLDSVYKFNWNFSNLEDAFEQENGLLHGKKVYLFGCTEPQLVPVNGENKVVIIPVVVAVVSPFPPSDKIGIKSVQRATEEIVPMKEMKMDWIPYIPLAYRDDQVERLNSQIYILSCTQRRVALRHLKIERLKKYEYCLPYFYHPFKEDEFESSTLVNIVFPAEPPIICQFDYESKELFDEFVDEKSKELFDEFVDENLRDDEVLKNQREEFTQFVKEKVREAIKANHEAKETRRKAVEEMSAENIDAYDNMRFYKFYPVPAPNTPDVSGVKASFINRYYGKAHQVI